MKYTQRFIDFYNGETDGFPNVKDSRWRNNHLQVFIDYEYIGELCCLLPKNEYANGIPCRVMPNGDIFISDFENICKIFGVNPETLEPRK